MSPAPAGPVVLPPGLRAELLPVSPAGPGALGTGPTAAPRDLRTGRSHEAPALLGGQVVWGCGRGSKRPGSPQLTFLDKQWTLFPPTRPLAFRTGAPGQEVMSIRRW